MEKNNRHAHPTAFFDAEYTCPTGNELLSAGIVICHKDGSEIDRLYRLIRPVNCTITPFCTNLTGIRQSDAEKGVPYAEAMEEIYSLLKKHHVRRICVWGNDAVVIKNDFMKYHSHLPEKTVAHINWLISHMRDVSGVYSHKADLSLTSLEKMKYVCALDGPVRHHALGDAIDLKNIAFAIENETYNKARRNVLKTYMQEHSRYNATKRFSINSDLPRAGRASRNAALQYMKTLNLSIPEHLAMYDDLCYMHDIRKAKGFPNFKDYVKKHAPTL